MVRSDTSLRSLGITSIAVDKPLKADIKALAGGKSAAEFLRELIEKEKTQTPQGLLSSSMSPVSTIRGVEAKLDKIINTPLMQMFLSEEGSTGRQSEEAIAEGLRIYLKALRAWPSWARDMVVSELSKNEQGELHLA